VNSFGSKLIRIQDQDIGTHIVVQVKTSELMFEVDESKVFMDRLPSCILSAIVFSLVLVMLLDNAFVCASACIFHNSIVAHYHNAGLKIRSIDILARAKR
jgi:hypothetical protein